ncbi:3'(2'),5'-bisphosphate nucleotidase CysQ [Rhodopila sp.]|jgi:3'(2'), 5'-bisphosphate nucleotidase|uniref:3'(2'),5'-bisphosphate nucleotidase CysQ n=1 Tax=Rhodopila sp. TaxID=2480087 RepID=UPI002C9D4A8A|nr:3'(2'),5'-bisphosphate nucleotidase CysQ [Rhodopila sp.]HVZ08038.1 3'(2'),5'-bisphosphate nucleotidase CysQ [Rhodopila sp.]
MTHGGNEGDHAVLARAVDLAEQAGKLIMTIRDGGFAVRRKADDSVVTEADQASESLILAGLREAFPGCVVVAEEEVAAGAVPAAAAEFWLVDPLDGTKEFSSGGRDFAVNIGLVRNGCPVLGAVGVPATGEVFSGIVGVGAWLRKGAVTTPIHARVPPPEGLTVVSSRHHGDQARLDAYLAGRPVARSVNFGSSLKFCRLAQGEADLYPRFGRTMEWDTCAPQAVLEAAGGSVETMDATPLRYGKPGWDNPHFVCWGRRA